MADIKPSEIIDILKKDAKYKTGLFCLSSFIDKSTIEDLNEFANKFDISYDKTIYTKTGFLLALAVSLYKQYKASKELYEYAFNIIYNMEIDNDKFLIINYKDICNSLYEICIKINNFLELEYNEDFNNTLITNTNSQKSYKRKHQIKDLKIFNLNKEQINKDFNFLNNIQNKWF